MHLFSILSILSLLTGASYTVRVDNRATENSYEFDFNLNLTYTLSINGTVWLKSVDTFLKANEKVYSVSDSSLQQLSTVVEDGNDAIGHYGSLIFNYITEDNQTLFSCQVFEYVGLPLIRFKQTFVNGVNGTQPNVSSVVSSFPSFYVLPSSTGKLGFLSYGGDMTGDTDRKMGLWNGQPNAVNDGMQGGPLVLFDGNANTLVLSSMSNFMSASMEYVPSEGGYVNFGVMGGATSIPANHNVDFIVYFSDKGINDAMKGWGNILTNFYGKDDSSSKSDPTINYLGYWTDEGAYYYWNTEVGQNYEITILDVIGNFTQNQIPFKYIQYDSWWYGGPQHGGCVKWDTLPNIIPSGMLNLYKETKLKSAAHSRYWSKDVVYAQQNGGQYNFLIDSQNSKALPDDQKFWDDIFYNVSQWGLQTYEQDWLISQTVGFAPLLSDVDLGRRWLLQMGNAAGKYNMTIQYCMALSRHILQSLEIPQVTFARASTDYDNSLMNVCEQWRIGISSMFAYAVNLAPFKDVFWTTEVQPGNPYGANISEPNTELQSAVATLSTGPVAPGDSIGRLNKTIIMRCCNDDGLILKPSKPITALDAQIYETVFNNPDNLTNVGEIWSTYSRISGYTFGIVLGADIQDVFYVTPPNCGFELDKNTVYWNRNDITTVRPFTSSGCSSTIGLDSSCTKKDFCLYYVSPVFKISDSNVIFLGEYEKWVPVSPQRISSIQVTANYFTADVNGALNETVTFAFSIDNSLLKGKCIFNNSTSLKLTVIKNNVTCK